MTAPLRLCVNFVALHGDLYIIVCVVLAYQVKEVSSAKNVQQQQKVQLQVEVNQLKSEITTLKTTEKQFIKVF